MISLAAGALDTTAPMVLFDNAFARGVLSGTAGSAAGPIGNVLGPQTNDYWSPATMPAYIRTTLPAAELCDCLAVVAHSLFTTGCTIEVLYSVTDVSAFLSLGSFVVPSDDAFAVILPPTTGRRWQLSVRDGAAGSVHIGVAMVGKRLVFPAPVRPGYVSLAVARRVVLLGSSSLGGHFFGNRVQRRAGEAEAQFAPLPGAWAGADLVPFQRHYDEGGAFIWAASPAVYPADVGYCWRPEGASELRPALTAGGEWVDLTMGLQSYAA